MAVWCFWRFLVFSSQNQEPGVGGQSDRGPHGPVRAARRARHHVHHIKGTAQNDTRNKKINKSLEFMSDFCFRVPSGVLLSNSAWEDHIRSTVSDELEDRPAAHHHDGHVMSWSWAGPGSRCSCLTGKKTDHSYVYFFVTSLSLPVWFLTLNFMCTQPWIFWNLAFSLQIFSSKQRSFYFPTICFRGGFFSPWM